MSAILTCADGSAYAPALYQYTAWAAARLAASVEVLHAYAPTPPVYLPPVNFMGDPAMGFSSLALPELTAINAAQETEARLTALALLDDATRTLQTHGISAVKPTAVPGTLPEVLGALENPPDLLLLGKRGESTSRTDGHLGSQLERIIRLSTSPVLVASHDYRPIRRFLISFDDSPFAHAALHHVVASPLLRGLACDIVMAGDPTEENRSALASAHALLQTGGYEAREFLMQGDPETVSAWEISANNIDLLVMGAYSHSRFLQFFIGSTTTEMIRRCRIPVLVMGGKMPTAHSVS